MIPPPSPASWSSSSEVFEPEKNTTNPFDGSKKENWAMSADRFVTGSMANTNMYVNRYGVQTDTTCALSCTVKIPDTANPGRVLGLYEKASFGPPETRVLAASTLITQLGGLCLLFQTHCHGAIQRATLPREIQCSRGWWAGRIFERPHPNVYHSNQISRWDKSDW